MNVAGADGRADCYRHIVLLIHSANYIIKVQIPLMPSYGIRFYRENEIRYASALQIVHTILKVRYSYVYRIG